MSVTFTSHPRPQTGLSRIRRWCAGDNVTTTSDAAHEAASAHAARCAECAAYDGPIVDDVLPFDEVNLANSNAAEVLGLLGYDGEELYIGSADGEDLLGRLLLLEALLDESPAKPYQERREVGRATLIDVGRRAGYVNERIAQLADLASWAAANDRKVIWG